MSAQTYSQTWDFPVCVFVSVCGVLFDIGTIWPEYGPNPMHCKAINIVSVSSIHNKHPIPTCMA